MARPPITAKFEGLFRQQLNAAFDYVEGLSGGGVSDGDKGDVIVSGGGTVWTLDAAAAVAPADIPAIAGVEDYVSQNSAALLSDLKITAAVSARFAGAYRARDIGAINWYFAAQAMTLAPEAFTQADRQAFCATAIDRGVVGPRQSTTAYTQYVFVTFPSGKVFFCNIAGTSAGAAPSDAGATVAGDFLGDGTITWEYTGLQVPSSWQWFMVDIATNLLTVEAPDSTDSYPAMLASAAELANVDADWLNTASAHPGQTRADVIDLLIQNGMTDDLTGTSPGARLSYVFQDQLTPAGAAYTIRYLADNVEVWRGYIAQAALLTTIGASATAALQNAADVKAGILSSQLFDNGVFKAYVGRPNWDTITGDAVYATDFRFILFPALYGMLDGVQEQQLYGDDMATYVRDNVPGLFNASLDTFPMLEGYYALWRMGWEVAKDAAFWRITSRGVANVVISDAAIMARWTDHKYTAAPEITDLAATVQAYTLDTFANPVASLDFAQQQTLQFVIENRTSDPGSPVSGQIWLRTDL